MSFTTTIDYKNGERAYLNGEQVTVLSSSSRGVVVVDENGFKRTVNPESLAKYSIYTFYQRPDVKEQKAKIDELVAKAKEAQKLAEADSKSRSVIAQWIGAFFRENDVVSGSQLTGDKREEFDIKNNEKSSLAHSSVKFRNQAYSLFSQATSLAHDMCMWG